MPSTASVFVFEDFIKKEAINCLSLSVGACHQKRGCQLPPSLWRLLTASISSFEGVVKIEAINCLYLHDRGHWQPLSSVLKVFTNKSLELLRLCVGGCHLPLSWFVTTSTKNDPGSRESWRWQWTAQNSPFWYPAVICWCKRPKSLNMLSCCQAHCFVK